MTKIKFSTGQTVNFNGTPTSQDVEEVAKSLGISSSNTPINAPTPKTEIPTQEVPVPSPEDKFKPIDTNTYAQKEGETGVLAPVYKDDKLMGGVKGTGNILSGAWNVGKFLINVPKQVFYDIPKEEYLLLKENGLVGATKLLYGTDAIPKALGDTVLGMIPETAKQLAGVSEWQPIVDNFQTVLDQNKGSYSKTFGDIVTNIPESLPEFNKLEAQKYDRMRIAFLDHPLEEVLGYIGLKSIVRGVVDPNARGSDIKGITDSFKSVNQGLIDMKNKGVIKSVTDPFTRTWDKAREVYNRTNKQHILDQATENATGAIETIKGLDDVNAKIDSVPKFGDEYNSLISERDGLLAARDAYKNKVETDVKINSNIIKEDVGKNTYSSPEEAGNAIIEIAKDSKNQARSIYEQNYKTPGGQDIPIDTTPLVKPFESLLDAARKSSDKVTFDKLRTQYGNMVIKLLLEQKGGNKWLIAPEDIAPFKEYLPDKFYKKGGGDMGSMAEKSGLDTTEINYDAFDDPYYKGKSVLDNAQTNRNNIHDSIPSSEGATLKAFDSFSNATNELIKNTVTKNNPDAWKQVEEANKKWENVSESPITSSALKEGIKNETVIKNVFDNWQDFTQRYGAQEVDMFRNLKAQEILNEGYKDGKFNSKKYGSMLEENRNILGNKLYNELSSVKEGYDSLNSFNENVGKKVGEINTKAKTAEKNQKIVGNEIEVTAKNIKTVKELEQLADTSGLETTDLGDLVASRLLKKHGFEFDKSGNVSNISNLTPEAINKMVTEWEKIGGDYPGEVQSKMFRPELKTALDDLKKANEDFKKAKGVKQIGVFRRSLLGVASGLSFVTGHYILGSGFLMDAILPEKVPLGKESVVRIGGSKTTPEVKSSSSKMKAIGVSAADSENKD